MSAATHSNGSKGTQTSNMRRRIYLIDRDYQLQEVNRTVLMFMSLIFVQIVLFLCVGYLMRAGRLDDVTGPTVFVGVAFVVPMIMCILYSWITIRRTHRVAGAAYRLSQDIGKMTQDPAFRFRLRQGDYLQNIAGELNRVMERVETQQADLQSLAEILDDLHTHLEAIGESLPPSRRQTVQAHLGDLRQLADRLAFRSRPARGAESATGATGAEN